VTHSGDNRPAETAIVLAIVLAGAWWGASYWRASLAAGRPPIFYQEYFEPAVMTACGHGFVISTAQPKPLEDFLWRRRDRFSCDELPPTLATMPAGIAQNGMRYLMVTVAGAWRVLGISWSGLGPLSGVMFGAALAAAYGIFRLAAPRLISVLAVTALATSTLQLRNAPHLRDFGKAPFALTLILLAGWMVRERFSSRTIAIAAVYGAVAGVAYGFRTDFLVYLPIFLIALFLCVDGGLLRNLPRKALASVAMLAAFIASAWPVLSAVTAQGGCEWHVAILGFASPFDDALGMEKTLYVPGYAYNDDFVYSSVAAFAARQEPPATNIAYCSREYDVASRAYFFSVVRALPADVLARTYASARGMWELPFHWQGAPFPGWHPWLYRLRARALLLLAPLGTAAIVLAVLLIAARAPRLAFAVCLFLLYFGGYPALQSDERHYFHLEFITWWAMAVVATVGWSTITTRRWPVDAPAVALTRALTVAIVVAVGLAAPLIALRWHQQRELERYFERYIQAPKIAPGTVRDQALIEADIDAAACGPSATVTAVYDTSVPTMDFTHAFPAGTSSGVTRVFFPAYRQFREVTAASGDHVCPVTVSQVADVRQFPLLMVAVLAPDWERAALYQRFR